MLFLIHVDILLMRQQMVSWGIFSQTWIRILVSSWTVCGATLQLQMLHDHTWGPRGARLDSSLWDEKANTISALITYETADKLQPHEIRHCPAKEGTKGQLHQNMVYQWVWGACFSSQQQSRYLCLCHMCSVWTCSRPSLGKDNGQQSTNVECGNSSFVAIAQAPRVDVGPSHHPHGRCMIRITVQSITKNFSKDVYRRSCFRGVVYDVYFASTTFPFFFFF